VKERPILFSAPMVRALLRGEKTQTRRRVKPQPAHGCRYEMNGSGTHALHLSSVPGHECVPPTARSVDHRLPCPYGVPGDRLWVRETFRLGAGAFSTPHYRADEDEPPAPGQWKPSIFMPRYASRITLEVTGVRVQRVRDITEDDAIAEGIVETGEVFMGCNLYDYRDAPREGIMTARGAYARLWCDINGASSWDENPIVWAVSFKVVKP
jgi:hypothetical protein